MLVLRVAAVVLVLTIFMECQQCYAGTLCCAQTRERVPLRLRWRFQHVPFVMLGCTQASKLALTVCIFRARVDYGIHATLQNSEVNICCRSQDGPVSCSQALTVLLHLAMGPVWWHQLPTRRVQ